MFHFGSCSNNSIETKKRETMVFTKPFSLKMQFQINYCVSSECSSKIQLKQELRGNNTWSEKRTLYHHPSMPHRMVLSYRAAVQTVSVLYNASPRSGDGRRSFVVLVSLHSKATDTENGIKRTVATDTSSSSHLLSLSYSTLTPCQQPDTATTYNNNIT